MTTQLMVKNPENIRQTALASLQNGQELLNKNYLAQLEHYAPMLLTQNNTLSYGLDTRLYKIDRIVLENKQSTLESLTAAYTALGSAGYSVFLFLKSDGMATDIYLGVRGIPKKMMGAEAGELVHQVFKGHFSGSQLTSINNQETEKLLFGLNQTTKNLPPSVTAVTGVPSPSVVEREFFMQGLEKFIDAAEGRCYQALLLAEPIGVSQLNTIQRGYESVATQLSPLLKQSLSFGENESESIGLSIGESISQSFGQSLSLTETKGTNESTTNTFTTGKNESSTNGTSSSETSKSSASKGIAIGGTILGVATGFVGGPFAAGAVGLATNVLSTAFGKSETSGTSSSNTTGTSTSESNGSTRGTSYSEGLTEGYTNTDSYSTNYNKSVNNTLGSSRQITLETVDKGIEQLLKQVDHQLERVAEARRYGAWHTAAYFVGDSTASSRSLASVFLGLMRGENSNSENFALTTWNSDKSRMLLPWLCNLTHPRLMSDLTRNLHIPYLTPATLVSGKEMAVQLSLPRRSTSTVSVVEAKTFGRQIQNVDGFTPKAEKIVDLGVVRHLWTDLPQKVELDVKKLASHIFISGSTGSGKSNTVYQLLEQLNKNDVKFMVIEPAKGEYKNVFGHRDDVVVFGTNPLQAQLLKINPFKFPKGVYVLEHIDRLVEIFNVCWPMYAAMPAVLKDAMLESYKTSGWDLDTSCNLFGKDNLFPTFADLLIQLEKVIQQSAFSEEVKSNYIGSLVTRVKSLTNGLNGQIFAADEIENKQLFDSNVIVDLSRIGSQETKSLIMGILVMRLSEHRMSSADGMNQPLKHVTVLEEAHNILKRTSTEQSSEGSNVAGKAVEMLSNAIAEMRTYGEGFIIADQSPSAVDISAIRNTNTKIIMRLPDEADRRLAGKASGATDEQLEEIAKLPKGVAVVYQNDWLEPVLCKIHHFGSEEKPYEYEPKESPQAVKKVFHQNMADLLFSQKTNKRLDFADISRSIEQSKLGVEYKNYFLEVTNRLEQGTVPPILEQDDAYLLDLYQRIIQQHIDMVNADLSIELQQHLANIM
ncbi:ATP-binding protein [Aggregatibacter actinomycetemcomitans]|uniref:ATPase, T2SS/T4P/T4SS family n=1 Tax=Aggregatibacter actinomycetemcomitans TaxID=714 RepID=UPI00197B1FA9|nr:ATPase, T2SS/T4P/T4SS family [Aggregatibacter actinomycetemcomitans]MBN6077487.1 ATP-binding protein [Aggregatibacter actinomycetemcomitans]